MVIEFRCPNGHRLSCPDELAGRAGKCPKCSSTFRVPAAGSTLAASDSGVSQPEVRDNDDSDVAEAEPGSGKGFAGLASGNAESEGPPSSLSPRTAREETIVFLCPNGHKLNSPASMQGRPGKCPHCGAKFIIPQYEEAELEGDEYGETDASDPLAAGDDYLAAQPEAEEYHAESFNGSDGLPFDFEDIVGTGAVEPARPRAEPHHMARLFARLWQQRGESGVVEIYLRGGERVVPDWYAPRLSQESCGIFAAHDQDGRYTLTAVNWDAIERISVRGMEELPEGMFG